jgi:two-component system KDP operon response regulator KdpE
VNNLQDKKILIVDDDPDMLRLVEHHLFKTGVQVFKATNGMQGLRQFYTHRPDLVILDLMMPDLDGYQVSTRILELADIPIIILSALSRENDVVHGFEAGAIDYVVKPFSPSIFIARVQAALRQSKPVSRIEQAAAYSDGYLTIDLSERRVLVDGQPVKLTPTEYRLLVILFQNAGHIVTFQQILEQVWGWEYQDNSDYIHVYISHLRRKLEPDPKKPHYLLTEYGLGYQFAKKASLSYEHVN